VCGSDPRIGIPSDVETDADRWLADHPKVAVTFPNRPSGDWRLEEGYGWIFKAWFRTWAESRAAMKAISEAGWQPNFWGRKIRVSVRDGYDGQKLAEFVLDRWPHVRRIQLRCD
jgi:hypothetical protein